MKNHCAENERIKRRYFCSESVGHPPSGVQAQDGKPVPPVSWSWLGRRPMNGSFLKEAKRHSESAVDAAAKALSRFEAYTRYREFKAFHFNQAIAFKKHLAEQKGQHSGKQLSKATLHATLSQLKRFFHWLAWQPSYKSRLQYSDAEYFNLSDKDTRIATAQRQQRVPTLERSSTSLRRCRPRRILSAATALWWHSRC